MNRLHAPFRRRPELSNSIKSHQPAAPGLSRGDLLRWLYTGRLTLVTGILVAALYTWFNAQRADLLGVIVLFLVSAASPRRRSGTRM